MAVRGETVRVHGYREFLRACDKAGKESKKEVRAAFREVGDIVRTDAVDRLSDISPRSAAGLRTRVRARGVSVEQSLRRTTGKRPDFGRLQMREVLIPALQENERDINNAMGEALERVADHFERGA